MDMGDILDKWENIQKKEKIAERQKSENKVSQTSHKKANAPSAEEKAEITQKQTLHSNDFEKKINPMELWLRRYGTIDKDKIAEESEKRQKQQDRNYLINMKPEAILDLHGLHQDQAEEKLTYFINQCVRKKIRKVLIIHGKGNHTKERDPVLGELVRKFIEYNPYCGMSGHSKNKNEGGNGATWIILKW